MIVPEPPGQEATSSGMDETVLATNWTALEKNESTCPWPMKRHSETSEQWDGHLLLAREAEPELDSSFLQKSDISASVPQAGSDVCKPLSVGNYECPSSVGQSLPSVQCF